MSKYEGLEDIAQAADSQEVYETSDVEETWQVQESSPIRRDSISEEAIDNARSRLRFQRERVWADSHVTDFSDRIDRIAGYETAAVEETTQNKLNRIRLELQQLNEEIQVEGTDQEIEELSSLQSALTQISLNTRNKKLVPLESIATATEPEEALQDNPTSGDELVISPEEIVILDRRLSQLEKLLGSDFRPETSLQSTINDLFRKFKLLSNHKDQLASISHSIDEVNTKFEKSIAMRRAMDMEADIPEETQLHEVYTVFQRTRLVQSDLPFIIKRLETLAELHTRVSSSVVAVEGLESQISGMETDIKSWEDSLKKLENKLVTMNTTFEENKAIIMTKIDK